MKPPTVGAWRRKAAGLPAGARVAALLDGKSPGRPALIDGALREDLEALVYHQGEHLTAKQARRVLLARHGRAPALSTLRHWLARWRADHARELSAVTNPDRHRSHRRPAGGDAAAGIERLNQLWELDSTPADVMRADGKRHAVVVAIDVWSRRTLVLVAPTSRATAIAALFRRCILEWGVPEIVRTDEGADYTSRHFVGVIEDLELDHEACPPFTPEAKPFVERVIKTLAHDLFANLPGFTGHNVAQAQALRARKSFAARRGESAAETYGCALTAEELQARCDIWCEAVYGREEHDGLGGASPFARAASWDGPVRHVRDERALDALLAEPAAGGRTVGKSGIRLDNAVYIAPEIGPLVGERVLIRRDPADPDRIFVYRPKRDDPEQLGEFVCVAKNPARTGADRAAIACQMTAAWNAANREARQRARDLIRRRRPDRAMDDVLAHAAAEASRVVSLPRGARRTRPRRSRKPGGRRRPPTRPTLPPPLPSGRRARSFPPQCGSTWRRIEMGKVTQLDTAPAQHDLRSAFKAHLDEAGLSIAQAAREIGRGESTISRWLNDVYTGDNSAVEALVARWLETQAEMAKRSLAAAGLDRYAETGVAAQVMGALAYAQAEADIVTIVGPSGRGKTRAAERYCATRSGAFYLAVSGAVFTLPGLLSEVSEAVGNTIAPRSALAAEKTVIRSLRDRNYLLVVDEAHFLRDSLLDELRIIRDRARCGLALVANESIEMALNRRDQIAGRVGLKLDLSAQPVADVEAIAAGPLGRRPDKAELKILTAAARGPGGLHALRRLLARAFMVARAEERERIAPADILIAADEGVAADEGAAEEAA